MQSDSLPRDLVMSGIYGLVADTTPVHLEGLLRTMRDALPVHAGVLEEQWLDDEALAAFGAIHTDGGQGLLSGARDGVRCFFDGVVYQGDAIEPRPASHLLEQYLRSGVQALRHVAGHFMVAWWDERTRSLTLAVDKIGQKPIFYAGRGKTFAFASMPARVLAAHHSFSQLRPGSLRGASGIRARPRR
jgi:asparagine synthetase B (glutamine-hydrolysing)